MQYKIIKSAEDINDAVIEKSGITVEFSLNDVERTQKYNDKQLKEIEGKYQIEKAKMVNIEENHAFVKEMSDQDLFTAGMYYEAKNFCEQAEKKIAEFKEHKSELIKELIEIYAQIPELQKEKIEELQPLNQDEDKTENNE